MRLAAGPVMSQWDAQDAVKSSTKREPYGSRRVLFRRDVRLFFGVRLKQCIAGLELSWLVSGIIVSIAIICR